MKTRPASKSVKFTETTNRSMRARFTASPVVSFTSTFSAIKSLEGVDGKLSDLGAKAVPAQCRGNALL